MRVIAGSARRLHLKTIDGLETRPTTDRIKETLFNMINSNIPSSNFLDLFSGSGGIGIEALSRGAALAVFIENNPKAAACIRENLQATSLEARAIVMACDVLIGLKRLEGETHIFDTIFMDPPYNHHVERLVLEYLSKSPMINAETTIIIEASLETDFSYLETIGFQLLKKKEYKTNKHIFVSKGE